MRPAHTAMFVVAALFVAGSLVRWDPGLRIGCAAAAIATIVALLLARLRAHAGPRPGADSEVTRRIERIRAERDARMGPRRRR